MVNSCSHRARKLLYKSPARTYCCVLRLAPSPSGMASLAFFIPEASVTATWETFKHVMQHYSLQADVWQAVAEELGDRNLDSLVLIGAIPPDLLRSAINRARFGDQPLTAVQRTCLSLALNGAKSLMKQPTEDYAAELQPTAPTPSGQSAATGAASVAPHMKEAFSLVINQASKGEFTLLPIDRLTTLRSKFKAAEGGDPMVSEEITDVQLSALAAVLEMGLPPFVDMGVWGPFGERIQRNLHFIAEVIKDGRSQKIELPGADCITSWENAWRVFRTGGIMLSIGVPSVFDAYHKEFKNRTEEYPYAWHIAARADIRCRSEFWPQEYRRLLRAHASGQAPAEFDPAMPWNTVIRNSAACAEFWRKEFEHPAMKHLIVGHRAYASQPPPCLGPGIDSAGAASSGAGHTDKGKLKKRPDGRYLESPNHTELCYTWGRNADGCQSVCPAGRAHVCEWCLGAHRTINCPVVPDWQPPPLAGNRGSGNGDKGKGKQDKTSAASKRSWYGKRKRS